MKSDRKRIAVIAHDAGGAELLSSLVANELDNHTWLVVATASSPATAIFDRKGLSDLLVRPEPGGNVAAVLEGRRPDLVFCGTSSSTTELPYIREARRQAIASISFLDHWINQRERFGYPVAGWESNLPDFIAVSDSHAYRLAEEMGVFNLLRSRNYYIADLLASYGASAVERTGGTLLFISQAIREHCAVVHGDPRYLGYTQTDILKEVLDSFPRLSDKLGVKRVVVRLHPAEDASEYHALFRGYPEFEIVCEDPTQKALPANIRDADFVLGIDSMALLIAHLLGKPVISYMPTGRECCLPLPVECKLHSLQEIGGLESIPRWDEQGDLSFFQEYDLASLLRAVKEKRH